jgi:hypothetical protein
MAQRSFSELEPPAQLTLPYVIEHLRHYHNGMQAVLPGAWMLGLQVLVEGVGTFTSAEKLAEHTDLELACINVLLALIDQPLVAGDVLVNKTVWSKTGVANIAIDTAIGGELVACVYIRDESLVVEL